MEWASKIDQFRALRRALPEFVEDMSLVIPSTALSDVRGRVQEKGEDADGKKLKGYSTNPLPTSFFTGPEADPRLSEAKAKKYPGGISYLDYKKEVGRYTGKTDMTLSGRMWNNIGVVEKRTSDDGFQVVIAARNEETQAKLDQNAARYGDPLRLSEEETDNAATTFDQELQRFTNRYVTPET